MEKVKITFKDGTEMEAEVNGSCYIVDGKPDFPIDLSEVTVSERGEIKITEDSFRRGKN